MALRLQLQLERCGVEKGGGQATVGGRIAIVFGSVQAEGPRLAAP